MTKCPGSPASAVALRSRAALGLAAVGLTLPMARDLAPFGIRVVTIAPGMFETPLASGIPQGWIDTIIPTVPFPKRWGNPLEFGALVQQICENTMLNGEMIRIDGEKRGCHPFMHLIRNCSRHIPQLFCKLQILEDRGDNGEVTFLHVKQLLRTRELNGFCFSLFP